MVIYVLIFFVYNIAWCIHYGDYLLYCGGGSYTSVYIPPPMYIFHCPCNVYSCGICFFSILLYFVCLFFVHITPSFSFYQLCDIYPQLDENFFGGVCICVSPYAATCVF